MKKLLLLFLFSRLLNIYSQAPSIQWQKSFGGTQNDYSYDIQQTLDGGYISVGKTNSVDGDITINHGGYDFWIVKQDNSGVIQWQKSIGGSGNDVANSIQQTADKGFIIAGSTLSNDGDVTNNHGSFDFWVVKLDTLGNIQWQKALGGTGTDIPYFVKQTNDGGYMVTGYSDSNDDDVSGNHGNTDFWAAKLNNSGALQWQKSFGGTGFDYSYSVQQTLDGGYIFTGSSDSNDGDILNNNGMLDYCIIKTDGAGIIQWQKSYGGSNADVSYTIQQTLDGGYIVCGASNSSDVIGNHGFSDAWVIKLDGSGIIQWQKSLGGSAYDLSRSISQTNDGGYIICGNSGSNDGDVTNNNGSDDVWIVKLNSLGIIQWQKSLGGSNNEYGRAVQETNDGGYILSGYTNSNDGDISSNHGSNDFWTIKFSPVATQVSTSISENLITIYPNPIHNIFTVHTNNSIADEITITDVVGKTILYQKPQNSTIQIDLAEYNSGIYFVKIKIANEVNTTKIIKQ